MNGRQILARDKLNALGGRVGALVELSRQILNRKSFIGVEVGGEVVIKFVDVRLTKDNIAHLDKVFVAQALHVVANKQAHAVKLNVQRLAKILKQLAGGHVEACAFLNVNSFNHKRPPENCFT